MTTTVPKAPKVEVKSKETKTDEEIKQEVIESGGFLYKLMNNLNIPSGWWISLGIAKIALMIIAFILAWRCNVSVGFLFRVFVSILAALFSEIYVIYFFIYRTLLGYKCNPTSLSMTMSTPTRYTYS